MMKLALTLVVAVAVSYTHGQSFNNFDNSQTLGDVGIFDGRLVALDDVAQNNMNNVISGLGLPRERLFSGNVGNGNIDISNGIDLRSMGFDLQGLGLGVSNIPNIGRQGKLGGIGNTQIGLRTGVGAAIKSSKLRRCPRQGCTRQFIPARCRYTPIQRTPLGDYCLACPVNVCDSEHSSIGIKGKTIGIKGKDGRINRPKNNKNNKKRRQRQRNQRRRRRQERLCRISGKCFGGARRSFGNDAIVYPGRRGPVRDLNKNRFKNVFSANGGIGNLVGGIVGGTVGNVGSAIQGLNNIVPNQSIRDLVGEGISGFPSVPARDIVITGYDRRGRRGGLRRD